METSSEEWGWSVEVPYVCACGACSPVTRWRWVDAQVDPGLAQALRANGPLVGRCAGCQQRATGGGAWLEVHPGEERATLVLAAQQRGEVLEALQAHLEQLRGRAGLVRAWLLQPRLAFGTAEAVAAMTGERGVVDSPSAPRAGETGSGPQPAVARALVGELTLVAGEVVAVAELDAATQGLWQTAEVQARPVLLRGLGYPLLGVRLVASQLGEVAVIDAVVDIGAATSSEIFVRLAQSFRLQLRAREAAGGAARVREVTAETLARNAAICLESAQAQLGSGEFPPDAFRTARESLARMDAKQRLEPARQTLAAGAYRRIVSPAEGLKALERLDQASRKDNLARLLEVDGLPIDAYERTRKSVLSAAVELGLVAPARFWRRTLGADLVRDAAEWIARLVTNRSAWIARGDDLTPEQAEQAWRAIGDLCQHHEVAVPPAVTQALGGSASASESASESAARSGLYAAAGEGRTTGRPVPVAILPPPGERSSHAQRAPSGPSPVAGMAGMTGMAEGRAPSGPQRVAQGRAAESGPVEAAAPMHTRVPGLPRPRRSAQPAVAVSGEIGGGMVRPSAMARTSEILPEATGPAARVEKGGEDPKVRLARVLSLLGGAQPSAALASLEELDEDDLLAVLPPLAEVGDRVVPELLARLESPQRPLRQAAAIVLGLARDRRAIDPLTAQLGTERSAVWIDVAKALGNFGPRVVGPLCALLRGAAPEAKDALAQRVARTLAELVVSDGDAPGGAGRLAVENLLEVADPTVSSAARRALATLAEVRGETKAEGGAEDREIRRFSTRAYEAITTPELDADGDIEVVGDD